MTKRNKRTRKAPKAEPRKFYSIIKMKPLLDKAAEDHFDGIQAAIALLYFQKTEEILEDILALQGWFKTEDKGAPYLPFGTAPRICLDNILEALRGIRKLGRFATEDNYQEDTEWEERTIQYSGIVYKYLAAAGRPQPYKERIRMLREGFDGIIERVFDKDMIDKVGRKLEALEKKS